MRVRLPLAILLSSASECVTDALARFFSALSAPAVNTNRKGAATLHSMDFILCRNFRNKQRKRGSKTRRENRRERFPCVCLRVRHCVFVFDSQFAIASDL